MNQTVYPPNLIQGEIIAPSDKSISHRAVIFNSIAKGRSFIKNFSDGDDCLSTLNILKELGVNIKLNNNRKGMVDLKVEGVGKDLFPNKNLVLNAGNSGTTIRLMSGVMSSRSQNYTIMGDPSLSSRPMNRVIKPLNLMGASIKSNKGFTPMNFSEIPRKLNGIEYTMPVASAQVKSAIIIAAIHADSKTTLRQPSLSRDHTELMLNSMGAKIVQQYQTIEIYPSEISSIDLEIPGDISSAAYWIVAGLIHKNSEILIKNVGVNPTRTGVLNVLKRMGGEFELINKRVAYNEPVADILVRNSNLKGTIIKGSEIPILIDEIPILCIAASLAKGETVIKDASELRVKESDRLNSISLLLDCLGVKHENYHDGISIKGSKSLKGGIHETFGDHRIAMAIGIAGLVSENEITIVGSEVTSVSYKDFWTHLKEICG